MAAVENEFAVEIAVVQNKFLLNLVVISACTYKKSALICALIR